MVSPLLPPPLFIFGSSYSNFFFLIGTVVNLATTFANPTTFGLEWVPNSLAGEPSGQKTVLVFDSFRYLVGIDSLEVRTELFSALKQLRDMNPSPLHSVIAFGAYSSVRLSSDIACLPERDKWNKEKEMISGWSPFSSADTVYLKPANETEVVELYRRWSLDHNVGIDPRVLKHISYVTSGYIFSFLYWKKTIIISFLLFFFFFSDVGLVSLLGFLLHEKLLDTSKIASGLRELSLEEWHRLYPQLKNKIFYGSDQFRRLYNLM